MTDRVNNTGSPIGSCEFQLADVVGSLNNRVMLKLMANHRYGKAVAGKVVIRIDKIKKENKKSIEMGF